ncbi:kinase-like domain-containing protein [Halteromyces radiatus]|uniref:kinase-like domain-containing protein n=1 Tax=Halteromyces radiatus TaxID=101107 RepID=UPI002220C420|nr:kinase-like domain-containing protein [Halteromyces radiatus]KAI8077741.1 kinase-like domain-containing protein [Halteromyces radiatus]
MTTSAKHLMHHRLHPDFVAKYSLGEELGSGGFGFVLSAYERQTGREVAVKFIFREKVPYHCWVRTDQGVLPMEIYVLKNVHHPNIIQFLDNYEDEKFCYLVMELHGTQWGPPPPTMTSPRSPALSQTSSEDSWNSSLDSPLYEEEDVSRFTRRTSCDLFECIERHHNFEEPLAKMIFKQIVECVAHLDKLGICHRDIKDENIVIDHEFKVKLIDFGSSVILPRHYGQANKTYLFEKFYGTVSFASPEILMAKLYRAEPAEIWSLGVLLYTILFGEVPFADPRAAIAGQFAQPKIKVSSKCLHLISCLLERNPDHRPTIHQVLMHPWLRD